MKKTLESFNNDSGLFNSSSLMNTKAGYAPVTHHVCNAQKQTETGKLIFQIDTYRGSLCVATHWEY